jgi:hypothetical protein
MSKVEKKIIKGKVGGWRPNSGRKPKADEIKLIERLSPLADEAYKQLQKGIEEGDYKFIQLYFNYYLGKPKESKEITISKEQPLFNIDLDSIDDAEIVGEDG